MIDAVFPWFAGVIDVMGAIRMRRMDTGVDLPALYVSTSRQDILTELGDLTGMSITQVFRDYNRLGCGEHCTEPHQHVLSTTGRWNVTGARATVVLHAITPFMRVRKTEAEEALAAGLLAPRKDAVLKKMYALGWPDIPEN